MERPVYTTDAFGVSREKTWEVVARVHAWVEPLTGIERLEAQQILATLSHRVRFRYMPDVTPDMRFVMEPSERVFEFSSIINVDEGNRELDAMASEVARTA